MRKATRWLMTDCHKPPTLHSPICHMLCDRRRNIAILEGKEGVSMSRVLHEQVVVMSEVPSGLSRVTPGEGGNLTRLARRKPRQEIPNGSVLPRSPLGAVIGLAALVLV